MEDWSLKPVGVVRCGVRERKQMPVWGVPAEIEIFPEFEAGLHRIEKHTHVWILGWLVQGKPERDVLQVTPRGVTDTGPEGLHGVFAVRSPARPNPVGLTAARLLGREGRRLRIDRLDFLDGTPVIDIKPYFINRDLIFSAGGRQVGKPRSREDLRESLLVQAVQFHGERHPDLELGVRVFEHYRATVHDMNDPGGYCIEAPLRRPVLCDAFQGMTRVTLGRGTLALHGEDMVRIDGRAEYALRSALPPDVLAAADEELFEFRLLGA
ncbi:MAG: tRNA (N6-threonylcarbamoyladenosine(37)-N6)-methyltransferase TrmO [Bryobacteraceae bacterium]